MTSPVEDSIDCLLHASVLFELAHSSAKRYKGDKLKFKQALGSLTYAYVYGWRELLAFSGLGVFQEHSRILGIDFKRACPEITDIKPDVSFLN